MNEHRRKDTSSESFGVTYLGKNHLWILKPLSEMLTRDFLKTDQVDNTWIHGLILALYKCNSQNYVPKSNLCPSQPETPSPPTQPHPRQLVAETSTALAPLKQFQQGPVGALVPPATPSRPNCTEKILKIKLSMEPQLIKVGQNLHSKPEERWLPITKELNRNWNLLI